MDLPIISLVFLGNLSQLLRVPHQNGVVDYRLQRRSSIKDIIESMGIPHTEVGKMLLREKPLSFGFLPKESMTIYVYEMNGELISSLPSNLWPEPWLFDRFMVDVNALKLLRNMRMAGIDTTIVPQIDPVSVGMQAAMEERVILTRNRQLLKCAEVKYGQLLRSENHVKQLQEVVSRYNLQNYYHPFSRCLHCNGLLDSVAKNEIDHLLEPLTRKYYSVFKRCGGCKAIYWEGSHLSKMKALLSQIDWS